MHTETGTDLQKAADLLLAGELVAIPTETVYGLAANGLNEEAVLKIYAAKNRPRFNPLILHVETLEKAAALVNDVPEEARKLAAAFWPGPLTMLLPKSHLVPDLITAGSSRVALRVPNHPLTLQLLGKINVPLAAPSANPSGYVSPTTAAHVASGLQGEIPYILNGGTCSVGLESTIIGWNKAGETEIYRLGGVATEAIEEVLGHPVHSIKKITENPDAPGQLKSHYATHTPLYIGDPLQFAPSFPKAEIILIRYKDFHPDFPAGQQLLLAPSGTKEEAACNLFRILREADQLKAGIIIAERLPDDGIGKAVNDRLERAQHLMK
jgi:L-threonylcarbamoyladenylate synthase